MLSSYLLTAWRHARKNVLYISINMLGLSLGIACCLVAFFNWQFHNEFDRQHLDAAPIYKINSIKKNQDESHKYATTPAPLALNLMEAVPEIEAARYWADQSIFRIGQKVLKRPSAFVDPLFTSLFSFNLKEGSFDLSNNGVVLTTQTKEELFGVEAVIGQTLELLVESRIIELQLKGIVEDHPLNSSFKFEALMSYDLYMSIYQDVNDDWGADTHATFISGEIEVPQMTGIINEYIKNVNSVDPEIHYEEFYLTPLKDMAEEARYTWENNLGQNNPPGSIMIPTVMAIMILLVACFNFTNTSIALAGKRVKEIGVRKALGGERKGIAGQLFFESLIIVLVSLLMGIILAEFLVPAYNRLGPWIDLKIVYLGNGFFWLFLLAIMISVAVLGGLYPALYVSKFSTQQIFKEKVRLRGSNLFTRSLLTVQMVFSTMALVQGILYVQNSQLQSEYPLGFNKDQIISIPLSGSAGLESLVNTIRQNNRVQGVALASHHIGYGMSYADVNHLDNETDVRWFEVDDDYFEVMNMELVKGRSFNNTNQADAISSIVVNEEFMKTFGLQIQDEVDIDTGQYTIIGVINDFYPFGLWRGEQSKPAAFKLVKGDYNYLLVNVGDHKSELDAYLRSEWHNYFPDAPYEPELDNQQVYLSELLSNNMSFLSFFQAIVAIFLAVNALFTVVSISIMNRKKEIGVRKVMGASLAQILVLFGKGVLLLVSISLVLGVVLGNYMSELFLDLMFSVHSHLSLGTVITASLVLFGAAYLTIGYKVVKAANGNPVDSLRYE